MKNLKQLVLILSIFSIVSCTTEVVGPQGPQGPTGAQGESAFVFEYSGVNFIGPDYEIILNYADDFTALASDVTIVYLLWDVTTDTDGNDLEVWRQVPQMVITQNGVLQYNFDFSIVDFRLFLSADFDSSLLQPIDTDNWVVRTVVIPGEFWAGRSSIDLGDYNAVKEAYGLPDMPAQKTVKRR